MMECVSLQDVNLISQKKTMEQKKITIVPSSLITYAKLCTEHENFNCTCKKNNLNAFMEKKYFMEKYGEIIPSKQLLKTIKLYCNYEITVEVFAKNGYLKYLLRLISMDLISTGINTKYNNFDSVEIINYRNALKKYQPVNLIFCSPNYGIEPYYCLREFGGKRVIYLGEKENGNNANENFFKELRENYELIEEIKLRSWYGNDKYLMVWHNKKLIQSII